jgi:hypothetical protein
MILEKQKEALVHQDGEASESIGMSLDLDSAQVLMQMLSKNLYSDAIGSTIRECASNALDSHRRAGVDKPIVVSLQTTGSYTYEFSVEDFGTGLDADDVKNIISKYGKSTKRNSSTELGMMGLGFKAPLAYTSSFYFVCRKDGIERKYMMYEGEDVNTIDLLYETPTDQPNGVKVIIPVSFSDRREFMSKIKEQLAYFENVYFNVEGIDNSFNIIRHEYFQFSPLASDKSLHICLDNVYYPIDFGKLGIERIFLPVGLRFNLTDGIFPTPNRESIRYTQEAKDVIINRLEEASNYFIEKYNETVAETDDVSVIISYYQSSSRNLMIGGSSWDVHPLAKFSNIPIANPKFKGVELLDMVRIAKVSDYVLGEYETKFILRNNKMHDTKNYHFNSLNIKRLPQKVYVFGSEKVSGLKKDYLKSLHPNSSREVALVKKARPFKLSNKTGDYNTYVRLLDLTKHPKSEWRQRIQEFQLMLGSVTKQFVNLDDIEVPQSFIDSRKKQRAAAIAASGKERRVKLKGEIICKQAEELERWVDGKNCKWVSKTHDMSKFHQNKFILVYGRQEDAEKMDKWYKPGRKHNIKFAILSERELKVVSGIQLHNIISFSDFMKGKTKPFQRIATACIIDKLKDEFTYVFRGGESLESISLDLSNKIDTLANYHRDNFKNIDDEFRNGIVEHAKEINGFDPEIYVIYKQVEEICRKFPFLDAIMSDMRGYDTTRTNVLKQALVDLFKYHKHRIDWKNYNIRLNEDLPLEETLTTETVEELI